MDLDPGMPQGQHVAVDLDQDHALDDARRDPEGARQGDQQDGVLGAIPLMPARDHRGDVVAAPEPLVDRPITTMAWRPPQGALFTCRKAASPRFSR